MPSSAPSDQAQFALFDYYGIEDDDDGILDRKSWDGD